MRIKPLWLLLFGLLLVGCDGAIEIGPPAPDRCPDGQCPNSASVPVQFRFLPPMDLPIELRQANYRSGSCVHAAMVSVLRWQNLPQVAEWWRRNYGGGETLGGLVAKAEAYPLDYAYTGGGDESLLQWCSDTRRGAVIFYGYRHSIAFCGFVTDRGGKEWAVLMDNNSPSTYDWVERQAFVSEWRGYGGVAFTPVYTPAPPKPWVKPS